MRAPRTLPRLLALLLAVASLAGACGTGGGENENSANGSRDGTLIERQDLSAISLSVGAKDFTEQSVLGEILTQALTAAGAEVNFLTDVGGTNENREALLANAIDTYWEYNGTGWSLHLGQEDPSFDPAELTNAVRDLDLTQNGVRWIGRSPFNDTYGFTTASDFLDDGDPFTLQGMAGHLAANPDAVVCIEPEFPDRPDGLILFETATGYDVPETQIVTMESGVIYEETASGNCEFGEVFTTDGRIPALDLNLVEDPGVFFLYNVSLTMPDTLYQQAPGSFEIIVETLLDPLDNATMAELNRRASIGGEDLSAVARDYLVTNGLISA